MIGKEAAQAANRRHSLFGQSATSRCFAADCPNNPSVSQQQLPLL